MKLEELQSRIQTDNMFRWWLMDKWHSLYLDIINGSNKYPFIYDVIEDYYNSREQ